jgi:hypothetical protein
MAKSKKVVDVQQITVLVTGVCEAMASCESRIASLRSSTEESIEASLRRAMELGLKDEMLDSKHDVRKAMERTLAESYLLKNPAFVAKHQEANKNAKEQFTALAFAQKWNAENPKQAFALIPDSTRYNFFSAIRAFVKTPKSGLDLWGNKARAAKQENAKKKQAQAPRNQQVSHQETDADKKETKSNEIKLSKEQVVSLQDAMAVVEKYLSGNKVQAAGLVNEKLQEALNCYKAMTGRK